MALKHGFGRVGTARRAVREPDASARRPCPRWNAIQVRQKDKVGRPDIDGFETAMRRSNAVRSWAAAGFCHRRGFFAVFRGNPHPWGYH